MFPKFINLALKKLFQKLNACRSAKTWSKVKITRAIDGISNERQGVRSLYWHLGHLPNCVRSSLKSDFLEVVAVPEFIRIIFVRICNGSTLKCCARLWLRSSCSFLRPAIAQDMAAEQRAACKGDYDKFCKGTMPGGGRIIACLSKQNNKLTDACKKVVADAQKK